MGQVCGTSQVQERDGDVTAEPEIQVFHFDVDALYTPWFAVLARSHPMLMKTILSSFERHENGDLLVRIIMADIEESRMSGASAVLSMKGFIFLSGWIAIAHSGNNGWIYEKINVSTLAVEELTSAEYSSFKNKQHKREFIVSVQYEEASLAPAAQYLHYAGRNQGIEVIKRKWH